MKIIDLKTFPRRSHYEFFKSYAYPYMGMTANVDVTNLTAAAKERGGSTFLACLWAAATAANAIPELRQRMVGDGIVEYDHCDTAHTVALPDGTFVNCRTDCRMSFDDFLVQGRKWQEEAKNRHGFVQPGDDETELIFVSCVPWVTFTQVIQPTPIPADSNVRLVFGKFFDQDGRKLMPLSIQANHALVDGLHVGRFYQKFQELADSVQTEEARDGHDHSMDYVKYPTFAPLPRGLRSSASEKKTAWKNNILRSDELPKDIEVDAWKTYPVFGSKYRREQIKSVTFLDTLKQMPRRAWDVSEAEDGSVMAWVKPAGGRYDPNPEYLVSDYLKPAYDPDLKFQEVWDYLNPTGELYDLYIGAEGGMRTGKSCKEMFMGYAAVQRITFGGVLHTEDAEDMKDMFRGCKSLTELDLSSFDTSGVTDMCRMFYGCASLTDLDLSSFDTSGVKDMYGMFSDCASLTELDLSSFDTSGVTDMGYMFSGCGFLTELDLSSFDTSGVQDMSMMFIGCESLRALDLCNFDTSGVKDMNWMFTCCESLRALDLSNFDTSGVQDMSYMFDGCPAGSEWEHLVH